MDHTKLFNEDEMKELPLNQLYNEYFDSENVKKEIVSLLDKHYDAEMRGSKMNYEFIEKLEELLINGIDEYMDTIDRVIDERELSYAKST